MSNDITNRQVICIGAALVDSIIRGFDPEPISASGYRAESCSLNIGGEHKEHKSAGSLCS